ncbi:MAG: alpha/beta fold hydrolase [Anaerolineales bacterium]
MSYQFAEINGVRMHYDVQGEGEPLLLIHAAIANLNMWDEQMPVFTQHFLVIRHDVRGFGETPDPAGNYTDHDDIKAFFDHIGVERAHVVGISNGGRIAIDFALSYPEAVGKLVFIAPGLGGFRGEDDLVTAQKDAQAEEAKKNGDLDSASELTTQIWIDGPSRSTHEVNPEFRRRAKDLITHTIALGIGEGIGDMARPPAIERLSEIQSPTLLIIGDKDVPLMFEIGDVIERGIPNIKRVTMKDVSHLPPMENPEQFNQLVLDFLRE